MRAEMSEEVRAHAANRRHDDHRFGRRRSRSAPNPPALSIELDDPSLYISRELTWIEFNDRVLEEALDERNPLLERLKFIAIFGTNLDEYFMIRVAALKQQVEAEVHKRSDDGQLPEEQLAAIFGALHGSLDRQMRCLDEQISARARTARHPHSGPTISSTTRRAR